MNTPPPSFFTFDVPLIHKTRAFYLILYSYTDIFPKKARYTIGQKCENITLEILEFIYLAKSKSLKSKLLILNKADIKLSVLKSLINIALEAKAIEQKDYLMLEEKLQEIGRMLGGWIIYLKNYEKKDN